MRAYVSFLLNGQDVRVTGQEASLMLAPFLRAQRGLTGTKIACAEGACGSCSVLLGRPSADDVEYRAINACIFPVINCEGCHVVTVEGLNGKDLERGEDTGTLSAAQNAMVECHGAQCGFCTPGVVISLTAMQEKLGQGTAETPTKEDLEWALSGNLCRCTGYAPLLAAGSALLQQKSPLLKQLYPLAEVTPQLTKARHEDICITWQSGSSGAEHRVLSPATWQGALQAKAAHPEAVVVAGGTEVGVALNGGAAWPRELLSLARLDEANEVAVTAGQLAIGGLATWAQVASSLPSVLPEWAVAIKRWASPQLRNAGTVAGNIIQASPISDSLPVLLALDAQIQLESASSSRTLSLEKLLQEPNERRPDELLRRVTCQIPSEAQVFRIYKVAHRRAFDRSIVSAAFLAETRGGRILTAKVAFGGVGKAATRLPKTEAYLRGAPLGQNTWREAGQVALVELNPHTDSGASAEYRGQLIGNLLRKYGSELEQRNTEFPSVGGPLGSSR